MLCNPPHLNLSVSPQTLEVVYKSIVERLLTTFLHGTEQNYVTG